MKTKSDFFSDEESAVRRDAVVRQMANTPPRPKVNLPAKKKTKTVSDRGADKPHARRGD